jgi:hypothetical protein
VVSDAGLSEEYRQILQREGVTLHVAPTDPEVVEAGLNGGQRPIVRTLSS